MLIFIKALFIFLNVLCGAYDFSFYRIPNVLILGLLLLYAFFAALYLPLDVILYSLAVAGAVLVVGFVLYISKVLGAGDVKYLTVIALWIGYNDVMAFLFYMALLGGGFAIIYLFFQQLLMSLSDKVWQLFQKLEASFPVIEKVWLGSEKGAEKGIRLKLEKRKMPYGLAIASAAIIMTCLHL